MRSNFRLAAAVALSSLWAIPALAAPKSKAAAAAEGSKKSGKEISTDDHALDKQMDWETKLLGPNTQKKIDLAQIQKLQAEEMVRREKQEKIDQAERDRREREAAAAAAAQRNVKAPSSHELPEIPEAPPPVKPVEKHDDAFVDKLLTGKAEKKTKATVSNDDVDELLNQAKQEKPAAGAGRGRARGGDNVDQLLATTDRQASIKTTERKPAELTETVSAEVAAREAALKSIAASTASKGSDDRARKPAIPDAAVLRAQAASRTPVENPRPAAARAAWTDPFATEAPSPPPVARKMRGSRVHSGAAGRHAPAARPGAGGWQDPFDSAGGGRTKSRSAPVKAAPAARPGKHPPNWKDPFA